MKKLIKIMLAAFFISLSVVPLSVSAEDSTPFYITDDDVPSLPSNVISYLDSIYSSYITVPNSILMIDYDPQGNFYLLKGMHGVSSYSDGRIYFSGSGFMFSSLDSSIKEYTNDFFTVSVSNRPFYIFFNSSNIDFDLSDICSNNGSLSFCTVTPTPTPTPPPTSTPIPDSGWSADFNEALSNPYISQLVGFALENEVSSWYIEFALYQTTYAPVNYTTTSLGYQYVYRLCDSDDDVLSIVIFYEVPGQECSTSSSYCRVVDSYTVEIESEVILKSSWLVVPESGPIEVVDPSGNDLIENGNSSTQSASSSIDSITNSFNSTASQYESFESQFNSNLTSSLQDIDVSNINLGSISDFTKTASFIKTQFDDILSSSGIYQTAISFVLIIGVALLLLGRRL